MHMPVHLPVHMNHALPRATGHMLNDAARHMPIRMRIHMHIRRWVVVLRDLAAIVGQLSLRPPPTAGLMSLMGLQATQELKQASTAAFIGALVGVICFGPVLSVLVFTAKHRFLAATCRAGLPSTKEFMTVLLMRGAEEEEGNELHSRLGRRLREERDNRRGDESLL